VLSVVFGMGAALVADMLALRFGFNKRLSRFEVDTIRFLSQVVTSALALIVLTGAFLFLSNPEGYLGSAKFLTKMTVIGVLCVNGYFLHRFVFKHIGDPRILTSPRARNLRKLGFALGAVSLISWITALSLGVLSRISISYELAMVIYFAVLMFGILVSQKVETVLLEPKRGTRQRHK